MKSSYVLTCFFFFLVNVFISHGQDTLSIEQVNPLTHVFNVKDGFLEGSGSDFLRSELSEAQFTILGDYANSKNIATLTRSLLPILADLGYSTMAVDVGPISTGILSQLPNCNKNVGAAIENMNDTYGFVEGDRIHLPIPILSRKAEGELLGEVLTRSWNLIGLNNDSWNGLEMLIAELHFNLPPQAKEENREIFLRAQKAVLYLYDTREGNLSGFAESFRQNRDIQAFLATAALFPKNDEILASIRYSLLKSEQYAGKDYFKKNRDRIPYEKDILRSQLEALDFDLSADKMLVKANLRHASKGFQPDAFYGFSNTLYEMASFHGNKSLHIGFFRRYYVEDGLVKDDLDKDYYIRDRYRDVIQMGRKDEWVVIDLRPMIEGSFYTSKYALSPWIEELIKQYDLIIIPPLELEGENNHNIVAR